MLSADDNATLTKVGPGTPMGELLRRYWMPACLSAELTTADGAPIRVRLLGEDLVAFRTTDGEVGLLAEACPHRRASLYFGRNEESGLRCVYHGWKFDVRGRCVDMPNERKDFSDKITARSYPTHESGGVVWTYMGPADTITEFRDLGTESLPAGRRFLVNKQHSTCNWVQAMEGNIDSAHVSYLHRYFSIDDVPDDGTDRPGYPSEAMSWKALSHDGAPLIEVENQPYGFRAAGLRRTPNGHTHARVTSYIMPVAVVGPRIPFNTLMAMSVPIDDMSCWRYHVTVKPDPRRREVGNGDDFFDYVSYDTEFYTDGIIPREYTADNDYGMDREVQRTQSYTGVPEFMTQDIMITESMGPVSDRTDEHLGSTDLAVTRMRRMLLKAAKDLAAGQEPPARGSITTSFLGAEKILAEGEDWRTLGSDDDPAVREAYPALAEGPGI